MLRALNTYVLTVASMQQIPRILDSAEREGEERKLNRYITNKIRSIKKDDETSQFLLTKSLNTGLAQCHKGTHGNTQPIWYTMGPLTAFPLRPGRTQDPAVTTSVQEILRSPTQNY